ncbi:carboxymuconolactone decarboxylase family protein [Bifidobacterium choloepi]|uniref:Carboxymuconolactone decarboxylase family protein n=1 Tax=Bifidobacterium choloepi TaxID=2614131 RepID=A0A6I5NJW3_9BIFI|nr:carboxymuconolactone decarboxylase family protein [Bifidobacterium choloepi]NEG69152.1 carboxymuconolactone decarboxylase family protein [Bifidobacterium choloepi]
MFEELHRKMNKFWNDDKTFAQTDPEYIAIVERFLFDEVVNEPAANAPQLDDMHRSMCIVAALMGTGSLKTFTDMLPAFYQSGLTSSQLKEIVYQATAYLGFGRAVEFLEKLDDYLKAMDVKMPLEPQRTVEPDDAEGRLAAGERKQVEIFGERMRDFAGESGGPEESRHIRKWLVDNCFGDYYTRGCLTVAEREMVTMCFLASMGGCEPQLRSHIAANIRVGNDEQCCRAAISQIMPYIGYPRTLNALSCLDAVTRAD